MMNRVCNVILIDLRVFCVGWSEFTAGTAKKNQNTAVLLPHCVSQRHKSVFLFYSFTLIFMFYNSFLLFWLLLLIVDVAVITLIFIADQWRC